MKLLEFGMKYYRSKNLLLRLTAMICLGIVKLQTRRMEKTLQKKQIDIPDSEDALQKILNKNPEQ